MPSKVEVGPGDIRPQTLACLGVGLALIAGLSMFLLDGAWLMVGACLLALGVVFALVGVWADRKIRGDFRRPGERGAGRSLPRTGSATRSHKDWRRRRRR
jgi:uncharacterized membrane protein